MAKSRTTLLQELSASVRSAGLGGKTTAQDLRTFLTSLIDEILARSAGPLQATGTELSFVTEAVYPFIGSGAWTVNVAGRRAGVVTTVTLGASATNPVLDPAVFVLPPAGGQFVAGKEHLLMFLVTGDLRIVYTVTPLS